MCQFAGALDKNLHLRPAWSVPNSDRMMVFPDLKIPCKCFFFFSFSKATKIPHPPKDAKDNVTRGDPRPGSVRRVHAGVSGLLRPDDNDTVRSRGDGVPAVPAATARPGARSRRGREKGGRKKHLKGNRAAHSETTHSASGCIFFLLSFRRHENNEIISGNSMR
jgi:hypothetical protein